jgi:hypothetical protein
MFTQLAGAASSQEQQQQLLLQLLLTQLQQQLQVLLLTVWCQRSRPRTVQLLPLLLPLWLRTQCQTLLSFLPARVRAAPAELLAEAAPAKRSCCWLSFFLEAKAQACLQRQLSFVCGCGSGPPQVMLQRLGQNQLERVSKGRLVLAWLSVVGQEEAQRLPTHAVPRHIIAVVVLFLHRCQGITKAVNVVIYYLYVNKCV